MTADPQLRPQPIPAGWVVVLSVLLVAVLGLVEWLLGRTFLSDSGFGVWTGAWTQHTSQWLADPYKFSHVLHGIILYWLLLPTRNRLNVRCRFLLASLGEALWEVLENSPYIIERYRNATAAVDYRGDSILNSLMDLFAAMFGFWVAWRFDWKWVLLLVVAIEVLSAVLVRDNLLLNIVMLVSPSETIKEWQLGK